MTLPGMGDKSRTFGQAVEAPVGLPQNGADEVFEEDFTEVSGGFRLAEEGLHHAKVVGFERTESKSGNPQYTWQFKIIAGESKGIEVRYWTSLLPQARWKVAEALEAVGVAAAGSIARFKLSDIIGKPCLLEVVHDEYDGRTTHKVNKVYAPTKDTLEFMKRDSDTPF